MHHIYNGSQAYIGQIRTLSTDCHNQEPGSGASTPKATGAAQKKTASTRNKTLSQGHRHAELWDDWLPEK